MKKIMLIIISVIILFTACKNSSGNTSNIPAQTQIDPAEEFGGITFGMTKEEIIEFHGKEPDETYENGTIIYKDETFFNIGDAEADYSFDDNGKFNGIIIIYHYFKDSGDSPFQANYNLIKEELLKRYPNRDETFVQEEDYELWYFTDNRFIILSGDNGTIVDSIDSIYITIQA